MKQVMIFLYKFGHLIVIFNLILLIILIFFRRFGFAEQFGNYFLFLSIFIVTLQIKRGKLEQLISKTSPKYSLLGSVGVIVAAMLIYGAIFSKGPAVWGDAPFLYPETFKNFLNEPLVWESRGRLGVVNDLYFIYPIMFIYQKLGLLFNLGNDIVIRLIFYIPTLIFAFLGPWLFVRYLKFSSLVGLFTSLVYLLNTYIILIIDGGQVGVALAYSLFPLALLQLHKLLVVKSFAQFFISLALFLLITMADVRFAIIAFLAFILWVMLEKLTTSKKIHYQNLKILVPFFVSFLAVSAYWLLPLVLIKPTTGSGLRSDLQLISILHPLLIFSPHWPFNEFGKVSAPFWFFAGIPLLIFSNLFFKKNWRISMLMLNFLLFVFLAKGDSGFLGGIYGWLVDNMPMAGAFRDSTKFFAPVLLYGGILIGTTVENISESFKKRTSLFLVTLIFGYLIFLLHPALLGNMHGVLAKRDFPEDIKLITNNVSKVDDFLRTVWFPERHPLGFSTEEKPALDAKSLINLRPFASLNVGISDRFNFLHNKQFLQWMDVFGIKYLIFSGDTRKVLPNNEEDANWMRLLDLVDSSEGLKRIDGTSFPVYKTNQSKPRIFTVDKTFAVLGGDDIYQKLIDSKKDFSIGNQGFVFFDDGKFNPHSLDNVSPESVVLIFNQKEKRDLALAFLSDFFVSPVSSLKSEWALRSSEEYLKWKFEFLTNKVITSEFDYNKGIAFSTRPNEKLKFRLNAKEDGDYILAIRHMSASDSAKLNIFLDDLKEEIQNSPTGQFSWFVKDLKLSSGQRDLTILNTNGFQAINVVALIPKKNWEEGNNLASKLLSKFHLVDTNIGGLSGSVLASDWHEINYEMISSVEYKVSISKKANWLIFTDSYHPDWVLTTNKSKPSPQPFYSSVNGFYTGDGINLGKLYFSDQIKVQKGVNISLGSVVILISIFTALIFKRRR